MKPRILVVGAGFAGAVHARELAEAGYSVDVIDKRPHVAGNAFDYLESTNIRVHKYGPHLFHTNNERVVLWLQRFGEWVNYEHRVRVMLQNGQFAPLPVNLETINIVFGTSLRTAEEAEAHLARISKPIAEPQNAAEYLHSRIGVTLTDIFFRPYTRKMWSLDLEEMDAAVVKRIPLRYDLEDRYFPNDKFQIMPKHGYAAVFERILAHPGIRVSVSTPYIRGMEKEYAYCFNSMPIDEWFERSLGELPYRSIRFHMRTEEIRDNRSWSVTNFTGDGPFTRETWWHLMPEHRGETSGKMTLTLEEPCDYKENDFERYYPVKSADGRFVERYRDYQSEAEKLSDMQFIGRCGTYQYLDMHQVIAQSLTSARKWIAKSA